MSSVNNNTVYVVTSIYSPYKEEVDGSSVKNYVFSSLKKARKAMKKIAKSRYNNLKDDDLEEEDDRFFHASDDCIVYGEDKNYGVGYRTDWGLVKVEKVEIHIR